MFVYLRITKKNEMKRNAKFYLSIIMAGFFLIYEISQ
jgi:preprotein translocase subunit SecB